MRHDGRKPTDLRPIAFELNYTKWAEGSVLTRFGETHVLCNVTIDEKLPRWVQSNNESSANQPMQGWITADYAMLPRSTKTRNDREQRWPKGRTQEIGRLIGRSLRQAIDLNYLGGRSITIDCDVLQADGGTRTAAITGAWLALQLALRPLIQKGTLLDKVLRHQVAAVSVGLVQGKVLLDLNYDEDAKADADLNLVMSADGRIIEVQGTGERAPFSRRNFETMLESAEAGIKELFNQQLFALME